MSLEELMDIEVTSVSRRAEKLSQTASAIQVITGDNIRRSGATSLPEALRLATNLEAAQANSSQWAISARGFVNVIVPCPDTEADGRTVREVLEGVFAANPRAREYVLDDQGASIWWSSSTGDSSKTVHG